MDGHTPTDDPDFHVEMYTGLPYVMTFTGNHAFLPGEHAYWVVVGADCPSPTEDGYGELDANLQLTVTLTAGTYELYLVQGGVADKHAHITAIVLHLPPSPSPSPQPSPPPTVAPLQLLIASMRSP